MADNDSLSEFLSSAVDAARKAGEIIRKGFCQTKHVEHKGQVDLVTETDKACEELIFNHLNHLYPTHKFIGEETTAAFGTTQLTDEPTWIVDPLDGTTNFVHGFLFVCVSIGLTMGKIPTVGVVYNPIINERPSCNQNDLLKAGGLSTFHWNSWKRCFSEREPNNRLEQNVTS